MRLNVGIYNLHMQAMGGGEKLTLVLAEQLSREYDVSLFCAEPLDVRTLEQFFDVDLDRVNVQCLDGPRPLPRFAARLRGDTAATLCEQHYRQLRKLNLDVFINNSYASGLICPAAHGIFVCMFPHATPVRSAVDSYETIVAISDFSAAWVRQRWQREAEIIYPPCDDMGPPSTKEKIILHVGRFIADSDQDERHHKRQDLLLNAFKSMTDLQQGWQLHFAGSLGVDRRSREFAAALGDNAAGLPVFFHFNSPRDDVRELYRKASIYWHATGFGFAVNDYPGKQEHFGITTVEAMSAAAVPVVYASGGQKEIVTDAVDGFWWNDFDELAQQTRKLVKDEDLRRRLGQQAVTSSRRFGKQTFAERIDQLISRTRDRLKRKSWSNSAD